MINVSFLTLIGIKCVIHLIYNKKKVKIAKEADKEFETSLFFPSAADHQGLVHARKVLYH
jgi:hypothetical protein